MKPPIVHPAANVSRCPSTRQVPCSQADTCGRALAPADGRGSEDHSTSYRFGGKCPHYIAVQYGQPGKADTRVHDAPGWLR